MIISTTISIIKINNDDSTGACDKYLILNDSLFSPHAIKNLDLGEHCATSCNVCHIILQS